MRSLLDQCALFKERGIRVLVIDNTPGEKPRSFPIDSDTEYIAFGKNGGLASAYQTAFLRAKDDGCPFLVLLDQDSEINTSYILALDEVKQALMSPIGIWCPNLTCCGKRISPYSLGAFGWPDYSPSGNSPYLYGINSFSVVRTSCIEAIGGFDRFYWLDCLDFWLYERAQRDGWTVKRLNITVKHDLSLISGRISATRLKSIAFYESCFVLEYGSPGKVIGVILRLVLRGLKRIKMIGGVRDYGYYLREIIRGICVGLGRRRSSPA